MPSATLRPKAMVTLSRLFPAIAIAASVLAACGGAASPSAQATAAGPSVATSTQSTSAGAPAAASGPNIADVLKAGKDTPYKVTYKWTTTAGGQTIVAEQTWYHKSPNTRFDYSLGPGASFSIFALADATYVCTNAGGTGYCEKAAGEAALGQNPAADFALQVQGNPNQFNASFTGTQSIAGQQAQCYTVKSVAATTAFGDVTSCYSSSGVPLKTTINAQGTSLTMEASAFSTTVTDADFTLPAAAR